MPQRRVETEKDPYSQGDDLRHLESSKPFNIVPEAGGGGFEDSGWWNTSDP